MTRALPLILIFAAITPIGAQSVGPVARPMDYESFCKLDGESRLAALKTATPAVRADLTRTQIERWRDANKARLNDRQILGLTSLILSITPLTYDEGPQAEQARVKSRAVVESVQKLFTNADMTAMQLYSPCIPKAK